MGGYPSTVFSNRLTAQTIFVENLDFFLRTLEKIPLKIQNPPIVFFL